MSLSGNVGLALRLHGYCARTCHAEWHGLPCRAGHGRRLALLVPRRTDCLKRSDVSDYIAVP